MKKVLFLMVLLFLFLGTAGVKAQVRIGGNTPPNPAAALDLNAAEGTTTGTKGLALPRVTLGSSTATLDGTTANITGMLVYNTGGSLSTGVYYWSGTNWNRVDGATLGGDTIVGNEVTNATSGGGLTRAGSGTSASPYTLGIATGGVTAGMIAPNAVSLQNISASGAPVNSQIISNGTNWVATQGYYKHDTLSVTASASTQSVHRIAAMTLTTPYMVPGQILTLPATGFTVGDYCIVNTYPTAYDIWYDAGWTSVVIQAKLFQSPSSLVLSCYGLR